MHESYILWSTKLISRTYAAVVYNVVTKLLKSTDVRKNKNVVNEAV